MNDKENLPSKQKLLQSTFLALMVAIILLFCVVLPAEYGVDPTGVGNFLGLKKMGEIKVSLQKESKQQEVLITQNNVETISAKKEDLLKETKTFTLENNAAFELKADMNKGQILEYKWKSDGGKINFDVHGDSKELKIKYHRYEKGSVKIKEGIIKADFDGSHGWFWRNRSGKTVVITIEISGQYQGLKEFK